MPLPFAIWTGSRWEISHSLPIQATDRGLLHGLGLFETILATHQHPHLLAWHLERLLQSASKLHWTLPVRLTGEIPEAIQQLIESVDSNVRFHRLRLTLTGGSGPLNDTTRGADALAWISIHPFTPSDAPLTLEISPWSRHSEDPLAGLKSTSYAANLVALDHARRHGFDDALLLNQHGDLCETTTSNVFLRLDGHWHTPPTTSGCLPGICRRWLIESGAQETRLTAEHLAIADAIVVTNTLHGPRPVQRLDARILPTHPAALSLRQSWISATSPKPWT